MSKHGWLYKGNMNSAISVTMRVGAVSNLPETHKDLAGDTLSLHMRSVLGPGKTLEKFHLFSSSSFLYWKTDPDDVAGFM